MPSLAVISLSYPQASRIRIWRRRCSKHMSILFLNLFRSRAMSRHPFTPERRDMVCEETSRAPKTSLLQLANGPAVWDWRSQSKSRPSETIFGHT